MPRRAPESGSVTLSTWPAGAAKSTRFDTGVPAAPEGTPASSFSAVSAGLLVLSRTGASLTAVTSMVTVATLESTWPSLALNWNDSNPVPDWLAGGTYVTWFPGRVWGTVVIRVPAWVAPSWSSPPEAGSAVMMNVRGSASGSVAPRVIVLAVSSFVVTVWSLATGGWLNWMVTDFA